MEACEEEVGQDRRITFRNETQKEISKLLRPFKMTSVSSTNGVSWVCVNSHSERADGGWLVRLCSRNGIACELQSDSVVLTCCVVLSMETVEQLHYSAAVMEKIGPFFAETSLEAKEVNMNNSSAFTWQLVVAYEDVVALVQRIVDRLSSANRPFVLQEQVEKQVGDSF